MSAPSTGENPVHSIEARSIGTPALIVVSPSGSRTRIPLNQFPFHIGRQGDNHLVLRDNRASRSHARIVAENGALHIEDLESRHGVYVNGSRVKRHELSAADKIDFGFQDSYRLIFTVEEDELHRFMEQFSGAPSPGAGNIAKLRSLMEVARALQSSLSTNDVLAAVVDAALSVTGADRGFLLLLDGENLEVQVARDRHGAAIQSQDLKVPCSLIHRALKTRRELLSMTFDPLGEDGVRPEMSVADLEIRSVVCVPLIRVRTGSLQDTMAASVHDSVGVLYMDSRRVAADLSLGNREIVQTLALEASTILENARLLTEEREKRRMEEELQIARAIQRDLLPDNLPSGGWFRTAGSSITSREVGGDYFDVRQLDVDTFSCAIADVSGKGMSAALLAALLQGAFLFAWHGPSQIEDLMARINGFLNERAKGEKYATAFYCTISRTGELRWANAGHPRPYLVRTNGELLQLDSTGLPLGMLETAAYETQTVQLAPGDKLVLYSDGLSEAQSADGAFFDRGGFRRVLETGAAANSSDLHARLIEAIEEFTDGTELLDDVTVLVAEYSGWPT